MNNSENSTIPKVSRAAIMSPTINNSNSTNDNVNSTSSRPEHNGLAGLGSKGEYLQQLSTNALPPYCPVPPPIPVKKTYDVICCLDCGDAFSLKSSLTFHLERRSVLIKFPCDACEATKVFYNRCTLLSHIRSHRDKSEEADISRAVVTPLPRVFMDGLHTEFANTLDDELNNVEDANVTQPTEMLECSLREVDEDSSMEAQETNQPVQQKVKCLDCNEEFESAEARKRHLTNDDKIPVTTSVCNTCGMVCPSKCQLKAHQRLHLQVSPYVCPECGDSPDKYWANFQHHVKYKCFHSARSIGYKCPAPKCVGVSPSSEALLKHMEFHTEKYLKCVDCIRAYTSVARFEDHISEFHPITPESVKHKTIYKCELCDIVFLTQDQMLNHRPAHLKNQVCEYIFNCYQCGKSLENKMLLLDHIKLAHAKLYKHITLNEVVQKPPQTTVVPQGKVECILCNSSFHSFQGYNIHVNRAHININQPCSYCYMIIGNRKEMVLHGKKHLKKGHVVCLLCNNKKCDVEKNLEMHLAYHVDKLSNNSSACPVCNDLLPTKQQTLEHLRSEHFLSKNSNPTLNKSYANSQSDPLSITCHLCRTSFANDADLQDHLRTKHSLEQQRQDINLSAFQETEPSAPKRPRMEGSVCAKCDFQSTDRKVFKEHLVTHKTNKNTFQCQECGLCFVVEPALTKHLRIIHRISDTKRYLEEEGSNFMPEARKEADVVSCDSLICSVCFKTFTTDTALKTHMRSHGMAFIQANKSSAAN